LRCDKAIFALQQAQLMLQNPQSKV